MTSHSIRGRQRLALAAATGVLWGCAHDYARFDGPEETKVRSAFEAYKHAVAQRQGFLAQGMVDGETLRFWERVKKMALEADASELKRQPLATQILALCTRARWRDQVETLAGQTGQGVFRRAVDGYGGWSLMSFWRRGRALR